jgi:Mn2+/Fe2+ NRAMP family transporter
MLVSANTKVMGDFAPSRGLKALGWIATAVMGAAAVGMFATMGK